MGKFLTHATASLLESQGVRLPGDIPKVSLLDAIIGASRSSKGSRETLKLNTTPQGKPSMTDKKKNGKTDKKDKTSTKKTEDGGEAAFTPDEDKELLELKAASTSWREIAEQMNKSQQALKNRFKEIKPMDDGKVENKGGENKKKQQDEKVDEGKKQQKGKGNGNGDGDANGKKEGKNHAKPSSTRSQGGKDARFTMDEWMTLQEDDLFSFGELQCLSELLVRDREMVWTRIASAFVDRTGRRVHENDLKDKFGEIGGMG